MQTKLAQLINVPVMKDMLMPKEIMAKSKWIGMCKVDTESLNTRTAGDTVEIPFYKYIGDMEALTEGTPMTATQLKTGKKSYKISGYGKTVELTKEAIQSGFGDPVGDLTEQLQGSAANTIDAKIPEIIAKEIVDGESSGDYLNYEPTTAEPISYDLIVDASTLFGQDEDGGVVVISPEQRTELRKAKVLENVEAGERLVSGVIGKLAGYQVVVSKSIGKDTDGNYVNFLMQKDAVTVYFKQEAEVGVMAKDAAARVIEVAADVYFVPAITSKHKIVRFVSKAPTTVNA